MDDTDKDGDDGLLVALGVLASNAVVTVVAAVVALVAAVCWFVLASTRALLVGSSSGDVHGWNPTRPCSLASAIAVVWACTIVVASASVFARCCVEVGNRTPPVV